MTNEGSHSKAKDAAEQSKKQTETKRTLNPHLTSLIIPEENKYVQGYSYCRNKNNAVLRVHRSVAKTNKQNKTKNTRTPLPHTHTKINKKNKKKIKKNKKK